MVLSQRPSDRPAIIPSDQIGAYFPSFRKLEGKTKEIRKEIIKILRTRVRTGKGRENYLDKVKDYPGVPQTFTENWTLLPVKIFDRYTEYATPFFKTLCTDHPEIVSLAISIMDGGKEIPPHSSPFEPVLRFTLPVLVPKTPSNACYLKVFRNETDVETLVLQEGKGVLFDENKVHSAVNRALKPRIALLIDIARPYGRLASLVQQGLFKLMPLVT